MRVRRKRSERNEKRVLRDVLDYMLCDFFSLPAEGVEAKPDLRAEKAAPASGSVYTREPAGRTSRKSERRRQFAVATEEVQSLKSQVLPNE